MNIGHFYFSPNGETKKIALYFYEQLGGTIYDLTNPNSLHSYREFGTFDWLILSIPVYSQQIPVPLRNILSSFCSKNIILNITYGGISYGSVPYQVMKRLFHNSIQGLSITPVKHAYLDFHVPINLYLYDSLIQRVLSNDNSPISFEAMRSNLFAFVFERFRTHYNVKLSINLSKCTHCLKCVTNCPTRSISQTLDISKSCIRCLACIKHCDEHAITYRPSKLLQSYLRKKREASVLIR